MRLISRCALATVAVALVAAGPAAAKIPPQKLKVVVSPSKAGTKAKPKAISLTFNPFLAVDAAGLTAIDAVPFATQIAHVNADKNIAFNLSAFPTCTAAVVNHSNATCPKGSQVGAGKASARALGITQSDFVVKAYNGPNKHLFLLVDGKAPLSIHSVIDGVFKKSTGPYGQELYFTIPPELQQPVPGAIAAITNFTTTLAAKPTGKGGKSYVETIGCPKSKSLKFAYKGEFAEYSTDASGKILIDPATGDLQAPAKTTQTVSAKVPCSS